MKNCIADRLELRESTHRYFLDGKELLAVTYVFERTFITDFRKVNFEALERARIIGDYVHEAAYYYGLGILNEDNLDSALHGYLNAIKKFYSERVKQILYLEVKVCNPSMGFAGTADIVYRDFKNRVCLDDYKTTETFHPATALQTASYKDAFQKNYRIRVQERAGVRLLSNGKYEREIYKDPMDFHNFMAALTVANWKIKHKIMNQ